jgi:hypothetical protein
MAELLTRDEILAVDDLQRERVNVPEWGGDVLVRSMTGTERDAFESSIISTNGTRSSMNLKNVRAKLVAWTVIDEDGDRLFPTTQDVHLLGEKSAAALQSVFEVAQRLSGLSTEDVEELAKNSEEGPNGSFGSD